MITVCIPVGPLYIHREFIQEAIDSTIPQMDTYDELLLVGDMVNLGEYVDRYIADKRITIHYNPWLLSDPISHNVGVGLARNEHVLFLSSDDRLQPRCLESVKNTIRKYGLSRAFYWLDVIYSNGDTQSTPCGAACVTKDLWYWSGGYPIEATVGCCDAIFISSLVANGYSNILRHVETTEPPYWHRLHSNRQAKFKDAEIIVRQIIKDSWEPLNLQRLQ